jgi:hypothetical protein
MKPKYLIQIMSDNSCKKMEYWYRIKMRSNGKILVVSEPFKSKTHTLKMARMFEQDLRGAGLKRISN